MKFKNNLCTVCISVKDSFSFDDPQNKRYDVILDPLNYSNEDYIKVFEINVYLFNKQKKLALISRWGEPTDDIAALDGSILTLLQNNAFLQIDVMKGRVINVKPTDIFGCVFSLNKFGDDYIVYGEMEIARFDSKLNKLWSFSGIDIFFSPTGKTAFEMTKDTIKLYDFNDTFYEIDYNGKEIRLLFSSNEQ
ncbi:MAG: hypothetical protein IKB86_03790 [Clostridia bacterium]|nr:hypothetical protein [Clostridia bacterium]